MIWGFAFSAQKAADSVPAFTLGAARSFLAGIFLIIIILIFDKIFHTGRVLFSKKGIDLSPAEIVGGVICGAVLALASFLQQYGINSGAEAGKASFITALYVVLVPIYALALKKKAPLNVWLSVPVSVVGFYFLCITGDFTISMPDVYVLLCALIFPIHILTIDKFSPRCDGIRLSCIQFFTAGAVNLVFALIFESPIKLYTVWDSILPILFLGIGSSGIAYTLQILGQKGANPSAASILLSMESVFGVIGSALFLGEKMSDREYIGCAVVFLAVIISQIDPEDIRRLVASMKQKREIK
jgi:drug/metabolite transporter (DMT)-like permease